MATATPSAHDVSPAESSTSDGRPADATRASSGVAATNTRRTLGLVVALIALALTAILSVAIGSKDIPLGEVITALTQRDAGENSIIVWDLRIPRTVLGIVVGAALGISGSLIQALTRNPLADPGILGVSAGSSFFVALAVSAFGVTSLFGQMWFAIAGAAVTTVAVYLIGSAGRGAATPIQLTLAGVALGAVLGGIVQAIVLLNPTAFDGMRNWNAGSIAGRSFADVGVMIPFIVVGLILGLVSSRALNAVALGDDLARSLGTNVVATRTLVVISVTLLAGAATAIAGPISFVGLMIPHVARWIVGPEQRWIFAYTVVLSPLLLLVSDIIGRVVMRPGELQVGIVTAFIGAPVLIALVRRKRVSSL